MYLLSTEGKLRHPSFMLYRLLYLLPAALTFLEPIGFLLFVLFRQFSPRHKSVLCRNTSLGSLVYGHQTRNIFMRPDSPRDFGAI